MTMADEELLADMGNPNNPLPLNQLGELVQLILAESDLDEEEVGDQWQEVMGGYGVDGSNVETVMDKIMNEWVPRQQLIANGMRFIGGGA